jgi:hypothetical protein
MKNIKCFLMNDFKKMSTRKKKHLTNKRTFNIFRQTFPVPKLSLSLFNKFSPIHYGSV